MKRHLNIARATSINTRAKLTLAERAWAVIDVPNSMPERPKTRGECVNGIRPCPFAGCSHHLFLDIGEETGTLKMNFPDREIEDLVETCSLDVADRGEHTLDDIGDVMNITRERVRQIEHKIRRRLVPGLLALAPEFDFEVDEDAMRAAMEAGDELIAPELDSSDEDSSSSESYDSASEGAGA